MAISLMNFRTEGKLRKAYFSLSLVPLIIMLTESFPTRDAQLYHSDDLFNHPAAMSSKMLVNMGITNKFLNNHIEVHSRKKRDQREPRKIDSGGMSTIQMMPAAYYPFLMAEMIPGTVKTRHPSLIAVNGCPAYYIADHNGMCRQVFQYTVNFGQQPNKPTFHPRTAGTVYSHQFIKGPRSEFKKFFGKFNAGKGLSKVAATTSKTPILSSKQVHSIDNVYHAPSSPTASPPSPSANPRLVSLLRNAAKRFDLSFLDKQISSNSGENLDESEVDKVREKILSALKIAKPKESKNSSSKSSKDNDD